MIDESKLRPVARKLGLLAMFGLLIATGGLFRGVQELRAPADFGEALASTDLSGEPSADPHMVQARARLAHDLDDGLARFRATETVLAAANVVLSGLLYLACISLFMLRRSSRSLFTQAAIANAVLGLASVGLLVGKLRAAGPIFARHGAAIVQAAALGDPALAEPATAATARAVLSVAPWLALVVSAGILALELGYYALGAWLVRRADVTNVLVSLDEARRRDRD